MVWSKENLRQLYREKFGLELSSEELEEEWRITQANTITPIGEQMNIAMSPLMIVGTVDKAIKRANSSLGDSAFKKVRQELIPAMDFALFLKMNGLGEHLIVLRDNPDIALIPKDAYKVDPSPKVRAIPLEITFITDEAFNEASGTTTTEKILDVLSKKLLRSYGQHTTLLVVIDTEAGMLDFKALSDLLQDRGKNFHEIYFWGKVRDDLYRMARVYPDFGTRDISPSKDLDPLMY